MTDANRTRFIENGLAAEALGADVKLAYVNACFERDGLKALVTHLLRELNSIAAEMRELREQQERLASLWPPGRP